MEARTLCSLPDDMLLEIFSYLPTSDKKIVRYVNKQLKDLVDDYNLLKECIFVLNNRTFFDLIENVQNGNLRNLNFSNLYIATNVRYNCWKPIIKVIGSKVKSLKVNENEMYETVKENLPNLKCLTVENWAEVIELTSNESIGITYLEQVHIHIQAGKSNDLPLQLRNMTTVASLKSLRIIIPYNVPAFEKYVIPLIKLHGKTLEGLELNIQDDRFANEVKWQELFKEFQILKSITICGNVCESLIKEIFINIPQSAPLETIKFDVFSHSLFAYIMDKWSITLKHLNLNCDYYLWTAVSNEIIKSVDLRSLKISSTYIASLKNIGNVKIKKLFFEKIILRSRDIILIANNLINITELTVRDCEHAITDDSLSHIFRNLVGLKKLDLENCPYMTDAGFIGQNGNGNSIKRLRGLNELRLSNCPLTDLALREAFEFQDLRSLELNKCTLITTAGIKYITANCPTLETIAIYSCEGLDEEALHVIGTEVKRLNWFKFCESNKIPMITSIYYIIKYFDTLEKITLFDKCPNPYISRMNLLAHKPTLQKIYIYDM